MCQKKNPSTADTGRWGLSSPIGRETSLEFLEIQSNHHWVKSFILVLVALRKERRTQTQANIYVEFENITNHTYFVNYITIKQKDKNSLIGSGQIFLFF